MPLQLFHNARCSKSRETLALLQARGIEPEIVDYLNQPLSVQLLRELQSALGCKVIDMMRTKERLFGELKLADADDDALIRAIVEHPILLERPIVVRAGRAVIGRPPENALELL
ncbi:MAG: arsenate reductase (glutaredoxin) [Arenicellales bacterium]